MTNTHPNLTTMWATKGGSGATTVATIVARMLADRAGEARLLDLDGDVPVVAGLSMPGRTVSIDRAALDPGRSLGTGLTLLDGDRHLDDLDPLDPVAAALIESSLDRLDHLHVPVVIDAGTLARRSRADAAARRSIIESTRSVLVTRADFLSLRGVVQSGPRPDAVVLIEEPGRALGRVDVEDVTGAPVVAVVPIDAGVARAIDAGLILYRQPPVILRALDPFVATLDAERVVLADVIEEPVRWVCVECLTRTDLFDPLDGHDRLMVDVCASCLHPATVVACRDRSEGPLPI